MIVECPRCRARYRVEEDVLDEEPTFKCSRCSHIFAYEGGQTLPVTDSSADESSVPSIGEAEHSTRKEASSEEGAGPSFREAPAADETGRDDERPPPGPATPRSAPPRVQTGRPEGRGGAESLSFSFTHSGESRDGRGRSEPERGAPAAFDDEFSFSDPDDDAEIDQETGIDDEPAVRSRGQRSEPRFVHDEDELRIEEEDDTSNGGGYLIFLVLLVIAYGVLAIDLRNHTERAESLFAGLPIVGDAFAEDHLLHTKVNLEDVEGAYQQIKDDRWVFVISGRAVNASSRPLKNVQIESTLYDPDGKVLDSKSIFCGNALSLKIVRDLSAKEISLLQRLEPTKRFEIRPGESAGFTVVFDKPDSTVKEFTARVTAVQSLG